MKYIALLIVAFITSACSYNGTMGARDEIEVSSRTELFAPSVTIIKDKETGLNQVVGGQSAISQVQGTAGAAIGGYFIGEGLGKSGDKISNQVSPSATNSNSNNLLNKANSSSNSESYSSSKSSSSVDMGHGR